VDSHRPSSDAIAFILTAAQGACPPPFGPPGPAGSPYRAPRSRAYAQEKERTDNEPESARRERDKIALFTAPFLAVGVALLVLPWVGFLCDTWLGAVIGLVMYVGTRIFARAEEAELSAFFGADWDRYRAAVRVPWL
jgi:hypothetical protein